MKNKRQTQNPHGVVADLLDYTRRIIEITYIHTQTHLLYTAPYNSTNIFLLLDRY